jgi:hypothetical protein
MFGDLTNCTEDELLNFVLMILARPTATPELSAYDMTEIDQINGEWLRRDMQQAADGTPREASVRFR